jgi:diguanylate cyclase (GGDEF)-like protein/putative nucleotidyltransferase with HDIG domain
VLEQLLPTVLTTVALALLIFEALSDADPLTIIVAGVALVAAIARGAMTMAENLALLGESRVEALTDPLTGLGNRRQMQQDLAAYDGVPQAIAMFDLDGFKTYNDTYGHGAGDVLLRRIAEALDQSVQPHGRAYRMGGDEFSALLPPDADVAGIAALLTQSGDGFVVTASYGAALMPGDATDPDDALRIADARMYMCKFRGRAAADRQSADVLLAVMQERSLDLARHGGQVATLAEQVAANMGLEEPELAKIRHAAQLHDIGKLAVPEAILNKPGPLSAEEWEFMRQHTVVGERILRAAPALSNVAAVVRSTHERWDGHGYPDGVAGGDIPLAARIVFVCDALDAMTEDRVYRPGLSLATALDELTANAGTQFDPAVVEALVATVHRRPAPALTLVPAGIAID